jgi:hypothetical protein
METSHSLVKALQSKVNAGIGKKPQTYTISNEVIVQLNDVSKRYKVAKNEILELALAIYFELLKIEEEKGDE